MNNVKKRFNIIDFVVIIVVIGCIAGVAVRYNFVNRIIALDESESVTVFFMAKELSPELAATVNKKSEFYCDATNNYLGNPETVAVINSKFVYSDNEGRPQSGINELKKDLRMSFDVMGVKGENGFLLNGTQLLIPGGEMVIKSNSTQLSVIITEIR
ncbi:MAG: DUF4330 family protein [Clostridia bacterium]|nr:DUF4330 family protein [Clostridia bacterium]